MAEKLNWSFAAQMDGGPTVAGSGNVEVDGYLKLSITVPAEGEQTVEVLTGDGGAVEVLVISPNAPTADLTYEVNGRTVPLDGPHVLIGAGAVALLGESIGMLKFSNGTSEDATVSILAGRDATS